MNYYYHINERETLIFKPIKNNYDLGFEFYSKGEATTEMKIGNYAGGHWYFDDDNQRTKFLILMQQEPVEFKRAFKSYFKSLDKKPSRLKCGWVKFKLKQFRMKRNFNNWVYKTFFINNRY